MTTAYDQYEQRKAMVLEAAAKFPSRFGLVGMPGRVFTVSEADSYWSEVLGEPAIAIAVQDEAGGWRSFSKGTAAELRRELVTLTPPEPPTSPEPTPGYIFNRTQRVRLWVVRVDTRARYGYFEHDKAGEGGGLWFEPVAGGGLRLTDFDGRAVLPCAVAAAVRVMGFELDEFMVDPDDVAKVDALVRETVTPPEFEPPSPEPESPEPESPERAELRRDLAGTRTELDRARERGDWLSGQLTTAERRVKELYDERNALRAELYAVKAERNSLQAQCDALRAGL